MPYCPDCGAEVSDDDNFCQECGRELSPSSSSTGWEYDESHERTVDSQPAQSGTTSTGTPGQSQGQRDTRQTAQPPGQQAGTRWWIGVLFPALWFASFFVIGFFIGVLTGIEAITEAESENILNLLGTIATIGTGLGMIIAPVSFYKDKNHESVRRRWEPSDLYYLTVIPFLNILLGIAYWWQRRKALRSDAETASAGSTRQY